MAAVRLGFLVVVNGYRFEVVGLEDLAAVAALNVIDAVPARDHVSSLMVALGFHTARVIPYFMQRD